MKRIILLTVATLLINKLTVCAQDRTPHPISTAHILGLDGKVELVFDEVLTEAFTVTVLDITGKTMFILRHTINDEACESVEIPMENLRKGIYMVQIIGADGKTKTLKLQRN